MDTLSKVYLLSWLSNGVANPAGIFSSINEIKEALKVRFDFIGEILPIENVDYKINEFQFGLIDD
ncbi:MAG: hypothetical protein IPI59_00985 [Sphingobacteriales bacterium]|jgi:hypothetical protein|nr:hypothetical protein [Sphingobacteriales bacterium]MBP9141601.1 hypothetical protein [Chitinophagales bacterium]MDA0198465.1 hypothetical protein [Bacteroidota bacterium]MBK6890800.1 hypothetical protein [Sphingobacteriales bacterium]MBK7526146.1 hypothetical protein [Sphingobacteriales bacterium]